MRTIASVLLCVVALSACGDEPKPPAEPAKTEPAKTEPSAKTAAFQIVNVPAGDDLPKLLAEHAALAKQAKLAPFVEMWAEWCPPCKKLEAAMGDPRIEKAFAGVYLIRLDSDAWTGKLGATGIDNSTIPVFYELDERGKITGRRIDGGAWAEDIPENMAPPLDAFFHEQPK
jgi:thiol-disulfide isomerase/thioredoxin